MRRKRIEAGRFKQQESARLLGRLLAQQDPPLHIEPAGLEAVADLSQGRLSRIQQLSELVRLAAAERPEGE